MLGSADTGDGIVIADLEAGLGTLTRLAQGAPVDVLLVVAEPTTKSMEVASRAIALAKEKELPRIVAIANRVHNEDDVARIRETLALDEVFTVPEDTAVADADRRGVAPLDAAPDSPAVTALGALAHHLLASAHPSV